MSLKRSISLLIVSLTTAISGLADTLWLTAADATSLSPHFTLIGAEAGVEANGSMILQLQSLAEGPHEASFKFSVGKAGTYGIWAATTPQTESWASPFLVLVDGQPLGDAPEQTIALELRGPTYGLSNNPGLFQWYRFGDVELTSGEHEVTFQVNTRRTSGDTEGSSFAFYLDTLLVTDSSTLTPSGAKATEAATE